MSEENVEIVRRALEAALRRPEPDFETVNALWDPNHELVLAAPFEGLGAGGGRGTKGFGAWLASMSDAFGESWAMTVEEVRAIDDQRLLVTITLNATGVGSGAPVTQRFSQINTVLDGRVTRTQAFQTREEALEAAGLSE